MKTRKVLDEAWRRIGATVDADVDESKAIDVELEAGEISLHHAMLTHGSRPNVSTDKRVGFAIRYASAEVSQTLPHHQVILARGVDRSRHYDILEAGNGDVIVFIELLNGAVFSMTLTDEGSSRIGVREYIELKANCRTVYIQDGTRYVSEDSRRVLRRLSAKRLAAHTRMYRTIASRMSEGLPGDSKESLDSSCRMVLLLEEKLKTRRRERDRVLLGDEGEVSLRASQAVRP